MLHNSGTNHARNFKSASRFDKKGRETNKKTANVQMPQTIGVVRPLNPILHFEITRAISPCIVLRSVQLLLHIIIINSVRSMQIPN